MQCEDYECEASTSRTNPTPVPVLEMNELDSALHELGMLSTLTDSRLNYLHEMRTNSQVLNLVEMNTRFVSNVSMGIRKRSCGARIHRMAPYAISNRERRREERHRTRSENADNIDGNETTQVASIIDAVVSVATEEVQNMKKSKSLENVHLDNPTTDKPTLSLPEVELVSTYIQKLRVAE